MDTTAISEPETRWLLSAGYQLPDNREVTLTYFCVTIADTIGMRFRRGHVETLEYPGHLQDAAVTLWLAVMATQPEASKLLRRVLRIAMNDPAEAVELALEWWVNWFAENGWRTNAAQHYEAIATAQGMWGDILASETTPVTEGEGGGDDGNSLGK